MRVERGSPSHWGAALPMREARVLTLPLFCC